jgi:hypothetical protein
MELETATSRNPDKMRRRARFLARARMDLEFQLRERSRLQGALWSITDPVQRRAEEMHLQMEEKAERESFAALNDAIERHDRQALELGDRSLCVGHAAAV